MNGVQTQSLFREVNDRIRRVAERSDAELTWFVCECANAACSQPLGMLSRDYDAIRQVPDWFAVRRGHHPPGVEVVFDGDDYSVISVTDGRSIVPKTAGSGTNRLEDRDHRRAHRTPPRKIRALLGRLNEARRHAPPESAADGSAAHPR